MRYTWHPKSWSQQAREKADGLYNLVLYHNLVHYDRNFETDEIVSLYGEKAALHLLTRSYRAPTIRYRAAKRLGRLIRGKSKMSCKF